MTASKQIQDGAAFNSESATNSQNWFSSLCAETCRLTNKIFLLIAYFVALKLGRENRCSCTKIRNILPEEWVRNIYKERYWMVGWVISSSVRHMVGMYYILCLDIARNVVHVNLPPVSKRNMLSLELQVRYVRGWCCGQSIFLAFGTTVILIYTIQLAHDLRMR
jgi:hypothetical protein